MNASQTDHTRFSARNTTVSRLRATVAACLASLFFFHLSLTPPRARSQESPDRGAEKPACESKTVETATGTTVIYTPEGCENETGGTPTQDAPAPRPVDPFENLDFNIHGFRYLKYRDYTASGNDRRFRSQQGFSAFDHRIEQGTSIQAEAKVADAVSFTADLNDMPGQERQFWVKVKAGKTEAQMGDFNVAFPGGAFTSFSKKITGVWAAWRAKRAGVSFFTSKSKSVTQTEQFLGRNSRGPYDLKGSDLVESSVVVKIDNEVLSPDLYMLRPFQGEITFTRILTPSEQVTVTYERKLFALDAGSLSGVSADYAPPGRNVNLKASRLTQQAAANADEVSSFVSGEPLVREGDEVRLSDPRALVKNSETLFLPDGSPLVRDVDYEASDRQLYVGVFTLLSQAARDASGSFSIDYAYYLPEVVQRNIETFLFEDNVAFFDKVFEPNIYGGSETVQVCRIVNGRCDSDGFCDVLDPQETDPAALSYVIRETDNSIEFNRPPITLQDECVAVNYSKVPSAPSGSSAFDQYVNEFAAAWKPRSNLNVRFETANSQADIGNKPIPVVAETVAQIQSDLFCPSGLDPDPCAFPLAHAPVVEDSVTVFLNDMSSPDSVLPRRSFSVNRASGILTVQQSLPAGTRIFANYQFNPPSGGLEKGTVTRVGATGSSGKLSYGLSVYDGDTRFVPIGQENTLETARLAANAAYEFRPGFKISHDRARIQTARDIQSVQTEENQQTSTRLEYRSNRIRSFRASWRTQDVADNLAVRQTDRTRNGFGASVELNAPKIKNLFLSFEKDAQSDDDRVRAQELKTDKNSLGFQYSRGPKLAVAWKTTRNTVETTTVSESYDSTNTARDIRVNYQPVRWAAVSVRVNSQDVVDSRPNVTGSKSTASEMRAAIQPFWKIKNLTFGLTKEDRPSVNTSSSSSENKNAGFVLDLSPTWRWTPSLTRNDTRIGSSLTNSETLTWRLDYRPPNRSYGGSLGQSTNSRESRSGGSLQTVEQNERSLDAFWRPFPRLMLSGRWDNQDNQSNASSEDWTSDIYSLRAAFDVTPKWTVNLNWRRQNRDGALKDSNATSQIDWKYKLSKILNWEFKWKSVDDSDKTRPPLDFKGNVMETTLRAEFD